MQWIWNLDNYHFMCFLLSLGMLCKNQAVYYIPFSKLPLCINYLIGDLLSPKGICLGADGIFGWFPGFISNWKCEQCAQLVALLPAKTSFGISVRLPGWESWMLRCYYHQADNDFRKDWLGAHRYRRPFVFSDELLARWQRLTFGGSFILPLPALVWWQASVACTYLCSSWRWWFLVTEHHLSRFRKSPPGKLNPVSLLLDPNLADIIWFCLVYVPLFSE